MEIKELKKFIKKEDKRLLKKYPESKDKRILARMIKITEEVGELADEILSFDQIKKKDKSDKKNKKQEISEEFADVVITTFLLAETMKIDIEKALKEKIKNKQR